MRILPCLAAAAMTLAAVPAFAAAEAPAAKPAAEPASPDPMICERIQEIGSLLRKKKICMLKSQWDEQRRNDRANIERSQVQRATQNSG